VAKLKFMVLFCTLLVLVTQLANEVLRVVPLHSWLKHELGSEPEITEETSSRIAATDPAKAPSNVKRKIEAAAPVAPKIGKPRAFEQSGPSKARDDIRPIFEQQ